MTIQEIRQYAQTMKAGTCQYFRRTDSTVSRARGLTIEKKENGDLFVHPNRSTRRYYRNGLAGRSGTYELTVPRKRDRALEWQRKWARVARECRTWGLWPEYAAEIERGLEIGYEKVRAAYATYWAERGATALADLYHVRTEEIRRIDERLVTDGKPETGIFWTMNQAPKISRMNLGGHTEALAEAVRQKKGYHSPRVRVGSRENSAEVSDKNATHAWYSREYLGCGNGSYYLIISPTHAVFREND
jgi:hypothetical protein